MTVCVVALDIVFVFCATVNYLPSYLIFDILSLSSLWILSRPLCGDFGAAGDWFRITCRCLAVASMPLSFPRLPCRLGHFHYLLQNYHAFLMLRVALQIYYDLLSANLFPLGGGGECGGLFFASRYRLNRESLFRFDLFLIAPIVFHNTTLPPFLDSPRDICRGFPWLDNLLSVSSRGYYYLIDSLICSDACLTNENDYLLRDTKKRAFRRVFGKNDWIIGGAILRRLCRFGRAGILVLEPTGRWLSIRLRQSVFCFLCPTTRL